MKTKRTIVCITALFLAFTGISAQKKFPDEYSTTYYNGWREWASFKEFDFPVQTHVYKGRKIEARARMTYLLDKDNENYEAVYLRIFLKPDDVSGFGQAAKDSIAKYGKHSTVVFHELFYTKGLKQSVKGEADMYARSFSPFVVDENDKIRMSYRAVFDYRYPDSCKIEYCFFDEPWKRVSRTEILDACDDKFYHSSFFNFRLHDTGYFDKNSDSPSVSSYMAGQFFFFDEPSGKTSDVIDPRETFPESVYAYNEFYVYNTSTNGREYSCGIARQSVLVPGDTACMHKFFVGDDCGEVIMQNTYPIYFNSHEGSCLPFFANDNIVYMDCRARAKCKFIYLGDYKNPYKRYVVEQYSVSCMLYQNR